MSLQQSLSTHSKSLLCWGELMDTALKGEVGGKGRGREPQKHGVPVLGGLARGHVGLLCVNYGGLGTCWLAPVDLNLPCYPLLRAQHTSSSLTHCMESWLQCTHRALRRMVSRSNSCSWKAY